MDRTSAANSVPVLPAYAGGAVGYHADKVVGVSPGTTVTAEHLNLITEEIRNCVVDAGLVPDGTNDGQLSASVPILAQLSGSQGSQTSASGVALASSGANASGARVAILASQDGAGTCETAGTESAIIASEDCQTAPAKSRQCILAAKNSTAVGDSCAVIASESSLVGAATSAAIASTDTAVAGTSSAAMASDSSLCNATNSILVCSEGARIGTGSPNVFAIGYSAGGARPTSDASDLNLTFRVNGQTGNVTADGSFTGGGADYAECFPLVGADRLDPGFILAGDGASVRLAQTGDRIRGVTSAAPTLVGNARDPGHRYQLDDWGRPVEVIGVRQERSGYDGTEGANRQLAHGWATVALLGQVRVRVTGDVKVGDLLSACDGIGHPTQKPKGRPVEVMAILSPFDAIRGYGIALCLVG